MKRTSRQRPWSWERHQWGQPTTTDIAARRAGGRRRRNAEQQLAKVVRRCRVERMIADTWPSLMVDRGWQTATAKTLGVDRATVCRDVDAILGDLGITFQLLRALCWTPKEKRMFRRLGIPVA